MMKWDYDEIFERDINSKFFYTDYPGRKMMVGRISLNNAIARLSKDEYYTLVTYCEGETLPQEYIPLNGLESQDGTLFATLNPDIRGINYICRGNDSIQGISRIDFIDRTKPIKPKYLLGPGPETITLEEIIMEEYNEYMKTNQSSVGKTR